MKCVLSPVNSKLLVVNCKDEKQYINIEKIMNYLAHAFLSFGHPSVLVGNMISDYVKGKSQYEYPKEILAGIKLHRAIDSYTDSHLITKKIKQIYVPTYRLYAGAFVDVTYDYFLANNKNYFEDAEALSSFAKKVYDDLAQGKEFFPERFAKLFPYMKEQNWLFHYQFEDGIGKSFNGLLRRSKYIVETETAFKLFLEHKQQMEDDALSFIAEVKVFAEIELNKLLNH